MRNYCLVSSKKWHENLFDSLKSRPNEHWVLITERSEFINENLTEGKFDKVFIPHWSHIIGQDIYDNFECIVFHMTDLPYGRGGSPLQNLIVRGHKETMISAIRVEKGIDTGGVYLKRPLTLEGSALEIFERSVPLIHEMIISIIDDNLQPKKQDGEVVQFKRRKPEDGNIEKLEEMTQIYDHIRMLDCEGYPPAFLESESVKFEFKNATLNSDGSVNADVRIIKK